MKQRLILLAACLSLLPFTGSFGRTFNHPGILHSKEALQRIARLVEEHTSPCMGSYAKLLSEPGASAAYCMQGPFRYISRAGEYGYTKAPCEDDFNAAYYNALLWVITHDTAHADKSMEIIRAYSGTLEKIFPADAPLCAGLQGFILVNAAEIMRYTYADSEYPNGWTVDDTQAVAAMFRQAFLPVLDEFYHTKPYTNGNWGIAVTKAQIGISVFLDDEEGYAKAVDYFYHADDNGSLPRYISQTGQIQESGRDQAHCMLGVGCLAEIAEVAWNQGDDLYGALDNRIMKGYEYLSRSNLGYDVPFTVWKDLTGKYSNWQTLGRASLGAFRSVFEIGYNHYVERRHLEMPYTKMVLGRIRPEGRGFTCDNPGFGTLLFYLGEGENTAPKGMIDENPQAHFAGWEPAAASLQPQEGNMVLVPSGTALSKSKIHYNAGAYPYIAVKLSHLPATHKADWLTLSYSVASAPEFWTFNYQDATVKDGVYYFTVTGAKSNNGTPFSGRPEVITLLLDFGQTGGEGVGIEWIRSVKELK